MTQATDDIMAALAHVLRQMERDARNWQAQAEQHEATIQRQRGELEEARATLSTLRAAADQAISNLRAIKSLNDDPHIEEIIDNTADALGAALEGKYDEL